MSSAASLSVKPKPFLLPGALLAALLLCGFIAWMIESRASILRDGNELVLKTEPVDPRDLLRGRYVRLNYAASNVFVPAVGFGDGDDEQFPDFGREVFVTFEPGDDGFHMPVAAFATPPGDGLFLRGKVAGSSKSGSQTRWSVSVNFGIDRFYTNERLAPELERRMRDGEMTTVVVAVDTGGTGQIKAFRQDGVNIVTERLY